MQVSSYKSPTAAAAAMAAAANVAVDAVVAVENHAFLSHL